MSNIHIYVKSFVATSPEELEEMINAFLQNDRLILCDIYYKLGATGTFFALVTYKIIDDA